jgi:hypothetical protein
LTPAGRRALARERSVWRQFVLTVDAIVGGHHA